MTRGLVIDLRDVYKEYTGRGTRTTALRGLCFRVERGELVAVTGRSGSGKSTLVHLIAGLDRPTSGDVQVLGASLDRMREHELAAWRRRSVGIVFQFFQLFPTLTVADNLLLAMELGRGVPRRDRGSRTRELLERVGIVHRADRLPASLSGGEQQRAAIARALANGPHLVVADEPTGNLDSSAARSVFDLFRDLANDGTTVVVVTHDAELAAHADRVVRVADGAIVERAS